MHEYQATPADTDSFLPTPSKDSHVEDHGTELGVSALLTSDFSDCAQEWAIVATRQVLMQAIEPDVQNIKACQVLGLYWFPRDMKDHAHILTRKMSREAREPSSWPLRPRLHVMPPPWLSCSKHRYCRWQRAFSRNKKALSLVMLDDSLHQPRECIFQE